MMRGCLAGHCLGLGVRAVARWRLPAPLTAPTADASSAQLLPECVKGIHAVHALQSTHSMRRLALMSSRHSVCKPMRRLAAILS